jgi:hypothetical protein
MCKCVWDWHVRDVCVWRLMCKVRASVYGDFIGIVTFPRETPLLTGQIISC